MIGDVRAIRSPVTSSQLHGLDEGRSNDLMVDPFSPNAPCGPPKIDPIDSSVFRLNKKTRNMLTSIFKYRTIKSFDSLRSIRCVLWGNGSRFDLSMLSRVQLALSDEMYLDFFGANLVNRVPRSDFNDAAVLAKIPNLRYFEIWFRPTIHADASNPWYKKAFERHTPGATYQFPCRKGMVDAIMIAAIPYIRHVKSINLTGYVKTQTRQEWLSFWADKNSTIQQRILEAKKEALQCRPDLKASSLRCKCRVSCFYPGVADVDHENTSVMYRGWTLVPTVRSNRGDRRKEAIENYRFDFDDAMPVPEYREQDCFPIPFEGYVWV